MKKDMFYMLSAVFAVMALIVFVKGWHAPRDPRRAINGLPALRWTSFNPTDFVLYSEQGTDGAYRRLCTSDQHKCLSARAVADYINAHGDAGEAGKERE